METGHVFLIAGGAFVLLLLICLRTVPQATSAVVERFGRYTRTLNAGLNIVVPLLDTVRNRIDLREQIVPFPPQEFLTQDNVVLSVDSVVYFQVTDPRSATYEVTSHVEAIEQLVTTTLHQILGGMDLERVLSSRMEINAALHGVLFEATGKWGTRVNRIELKTIELPAAARKATEKEMRAYTDKRVAILRAEGERQAALLRARTERDVADILADRDGI